MLCEFWLVLVGVGGCWWVLVGVGGCWCVLVCVGVCWCVLVCVGGCLWVLVGVVGCWRVLVGVLAKNNCCIFAKNWLSTPTPASFPNSLVGNNYTQKLKK